MRRPLSGAGLALAAILLDPTVAPRHPWHEPDPTRPDRLTAATIGRLTSEVRPPTRPWIPRARVHDIPLSGGRQHLVVEGTINGAVTGPLLVDTGASYCVLTRRTASLLGLVPLDRRTVPVATANGHVEADVVELATVQLRDAAIGRVDAVIMDAVESPLIGIVGLNFLARFRFAVDVAGGTLRLEPVVSSPAPTDESPPT
jgi:clan AA aspartic protease (TIGR02281 family)